METQQLVFDLISRQAGGGGGGEVEHRLQFFAGILKVAA